MSLAEKGTERFDIGGKTKRHRRQREDGAERDRDGHKSRNASRGQKLEEARDKFFPRAFRGSTAL